MKKLENELDQLRRQIIDMGNLTEKMVVGAIDALSVPGWSEVVQQVMAQEEELDKMQLRIDKEAVRILTVYSPVAADLRLVMSVSRMSSELERIGDHSVNMCESLRLMLAKTELTFLPTVKKMAEVVKGMVSDALNAFVQGDFRKAYATIANDNIVDALNDQVVEELLNLQLVRSALAGPKDVAGALAQLLITRSLERIADQATNISEEIVYMVKGRDIRHQLPGAQIAD
jgi:phosphate transport system protein